MTLALSLIVSFLIAAAATPVCRAICQRSGWVDHPDARRLHRDPIPRAGGIAIFLGYAAALGTSHYRMILPAVLVAFGTGLLDDLIAVKPRTKIAGQVLAALLACAGGIQILGAGVWWHIPLTIVWLVGCSNAVNLIDGLDGLAAGIGIFATGAALGTALLTGNSALAAVTAPLLGALLGFLPYNFNPASIFMGDGGSNTIGFLLGCFAILWCQTNPTASGLAAPVIALGIPILDTALAIFRRFLRGAPIFSADLGHIHHRLLARGFTPRSVACILYGGAGFFACLAMLLTTGTYSSGSMVAAFCIVVWLALRYLRYDEFDAVRRVILGGAIRSVVSADLHVRKLEAALLSAHSLDECWSALQNGGLSLGLSRATLQVYGRTFSARFSDGGASGECWSLLIPLDGAGTIDLEIPFGPAPASVVPLVNSLRTVLTRKLESVRPKLALAASVGRTR